MLNLKKLEIEDKRVIEEYTAKFPPYSDFSFLSLFTYNTNRTVEFGFSNDRLVVRFEDYLSKKPFFSFLGTDEDGGLTQHLLNESVEAGFEPILKLIPEASVSEAMIQNFEVSEDIDNFDYIISATDVSRLTKKFDRKKRSIAQFKSNYPDHSVRFIDLLSQQSHLHILKAFHNWKSANGKSDFEVQVEERAMIRLFEYIDYFPEAKCLGIFIGEELVAFNIFETMGKYGISSFQKADRHLNGVYALLTHQMATTLEESGCFHINFEQDLGIPGLRLSKTTWQPEFFLKKFTVKHAKGPS